MRRNITKAIIFDLNDALYSFKAAQQTGANAWATYAEEQFQLPEEQTRREMETLIAEQAEKIEPIATSHSHMLCAELWLIKRGLLVFPHATTLAGRYWQALLDAMMPQEGAVEMLRGLQIRNFLIGTDTDMTAYAQYKKIEKLGLGDIVDFIVTNEECGVDKPLRHFFKYSTKRANETPVCVGRAEYIEMNEMLFVEGSIKHDLEGAHTAKIQILLFNPESAYPGGEERVQRFSELPGALKCLSAEM